MNDEVFYIERTVKSKHEGGGWKKLIFHNDSLEPVQMWWHDWTGKRVKYWRIWPGKSIEQWTAAGHAWSTTPLVASKSESRFYTNGEAVFIASAEDDGQTFLIEEQHVMNLIENMEDPNPHHDHDHSIPFLGKW
jgi:hypothetical protein